MDTSEDAHIAEQLAAEFEEALRAEEIEQVEKDERYARNMWEEELQEAAQARRASTEEDDERVARCFDESGPVHNLRSLPNRPEAAATPAAAPPSDEVTGPRGPEAAAFHEHAPASHASTSPSGWFCAPSTL